MTLMEIKQALEELAERIALQRRQEKNKVEKKEWAADLESCRDLISLVELAIYKEIIL